MRVLFVMAACLGLAAPLWSGAQDLPPELVARTGPRSPAEERRAFRLPPGFDVELVASEPDIHKPMNLAFDARGRLWVTDTVEYPFPAPADRTPRDTVKILEDFGPDGRARKVTTFADGLNIPIGLMPVEGGVIVHSIPNIFLLRDSDGDGRADRREVLYGSIGSADTHGMTNSFTWGFDGWLYACHGFANTSTIRARDGSSITLNSGNTYRMRPDGSRVEQYTWGQVNPFGLALTPAGDWFSADCHSQAIMQLLRGGYYQSFGKPHDGLGFAPEITNQDHGSTGIAGVVFYAADHFPPAYQGTAFIGNVVTNRINHDRMEIHGSSYKAVRRPDFLVSDDPWFRPVDLKLGPDGALYVADFYNRIIGHYEVSLTHPGRDRERGRIWRIVYRGADSSGRPRAPRQDWTRATPRELAGDLTHPNLTVRMLATNELVRRGADGAVAVLPLVRPGKDPWAHAHALWVLERLGRLDDEKLASAAVDVEPLVRIHAQHVLAERLRLTAGQRELILAGLQDADPFVRRAAADALGRHPDPANIRPLLDLRLDTSPDDPQLLHTTRMALRNQLRPPQSWSGLATHTDAEARAIADVALGVPSQPAAAFLAEHVRSRSYDAHYLNEFLHHVARYGGDEGLRAVMALARGDRPDDLRHQVELLKAVQQGTQERGGQLPAAARAWAQELGPRLLAAREPELVQAAADLAGSLRLVALEGSLTMAVGRRELGDGPRTAACSALVTLDSRKNLPVLAKLLHDPAEPVPLRDRVGQLIASANSPGGRAELLKALATAPAGLQSALAASLALTPEGGEQLLTAVAEGKVSAQVLQDRPVQLRLAKANLPHIEERLAALTKGLPPADQRLAEQLRRHRAQFLSAKPDPAAGAVAFEKHCAVCHQLGGKGAKIGPQLDGVGARGLDRLLEDLLDPNRNVDQAFRASTLLLKNGRLLTGLVLREEGDVVVVADNQGKEQRVAKGEIEERATSLLSPMPANLTDQIPAVEFNNLLSYLLAQHQPPAK
jgi:putative heme-binding domain-containing protein